MRIELTTSAWLHPHISVRGGTVYKYGALNRLCHRGATKMGVQTNLYHPNRSRQPSTTHLVTSHRFKMSRNDNFRRCRQNVRLDNGTGRNVLGVHQAKAVCFVSLALRQHISLRKCGWQTRLRASERLSQRGCGAMEVSRQWPTAVASGNHMNQLIGRPVTGEKKNPGVIISRHYGTTTLTLNRHSFVRK